MYLFENLIMNIIWKYYEYLFWILWVNSIWKNNYENKMHIRTNGFFADKVYHFFNNRIGKILEISFNVNLTNFAKIWENFAYFTTSQKNN